MTSLDNLFGASPMDLEQLRKLLADPALGGEGMPGVPSTKGPRTQLASLMTGAPNEGTASLPSMPALPMEQPMPEPIVAPEPDMTSTLLGSPGEEEMLAQLQTGPTGTKRGPGRPPGAKNKPKVLKNAGELNAEMAAGEDRKKRERDLPLDVYQRGFLAMKAAAAGEDFTKTSVQIKWAARLDKDPALRQNFDDWIANTRPIPTQQAVEDPQTGEVSYKWINLRPGATKRKDVPTGTKKPRELVPSNVVLDWSQALGAIDNLNVMRDLADKVPSGIRGWLTQKALETPKLRSAVASFEEFTKTTGKMIPKEAYDYYAAWAQFRIAAQSIIKGIPSNYDVVSLLNTIGSLDMGKEQRDALLVYAQKLTLKLVEHQVALQHIAGRRVSPDMVNYLKENGVDPDSAKLNAYRELPSCPTCVSDAREGKASKTGFSVDPKSFSTGTAGKGPASKKSPAQEADEFLKGLGGF